MGEAIKKFILNNKAVGILATFIVALFVLGALNAKFGLFEKLNKKLPSRKVKINCLDCNVVLVSFDTLRAKNVGVLGYQRDTTPTIDRFAKKGINFTNAISVTSWTLPSHMSWFTGVYPSQHKVLNKFTVKENGDEEITNLKEVSPNFKTLAKVLKENGYRTGGFTGGAGVHRQFGFDQGFEIYTDDKEFAGFIDSAPKALRWIKNNKDEKLFVFLHGYDIHGQYVPEGGYDNRFVDFEYDGELNGSKEEQEELREEGLARGNIFLTKDDVRFLTALYDEKIQRADELFAKFIKEYEQLGLMDKTVFILTSDHGEELYEHGRIDHGHSLYDELIKVPLIITAPGINDGITIDEQVSTIDLMPTILDIVGINETDNMLKQMKGRSLIEVTQGEDELQDVFPETDYRYSTFQRAIRTGRGWKLIVNLETKVKELYQLSSDPYERQNKADLQKNQLDELYQRLLQHLYNFDITQ